MATAMVTEGLFVRLEAKHGKEAAVAEFLKSALPSVEREPETTAWFAVQIGPTTFGIFDCFPDESGRRAHLAGRVADALKERAPELFSRSPTIEPLDVLASKLPH